MRKIEYSLKKLDPFNASFLIALPILGFVALWLHIKYEGFNPYLLIPAFAMYALTVFSISGGYHRLFAHRAYKANTFLKLFYLVFGAASGETSAIKWSADHRRHHTHVDTDLDPHSIHEGFFFAHIGWVMLKEEEQNKSVFPKDLLQDKWVMWQHKHCVALAVGVNAAAILLAAYFSGHFWGSLALVGFLRLTFVHHITFCINSLCHMIGTRPYDTKETARDSILLALITFGEGYHNFHHAFQADYRNGIRWYQWDPTKWILNLMSLVGQATDLKRTSEASILRAKMNVISQNKLGSKRDERIAELQERVQAAQKKFLELKGEYVRLKHQGQDKILEIEQAMREAKREFQMLYEAWKRELALQAQLA